MRSYISRITDLSVNGPVWTDWESDGQELNPILGLCHGVFTDRYILKYILEHFSRENRNPTLYPFHIPCLELCIPFNWWKCTVIQIGINHKNRTFSRVLYSHKIHLLALRALSQTQTGAQMTNFLPFHILQLVKSLPFHLPEAWKRYSFWAEPSCIGNYGEYPPGLCLWVVYV